MKYNLRELCKAANHLSAQGMSKSEAFKEAWRLAKALEVGRVAGVTHGRRQEAIAHLTRYAEQDITLQLLREQDNAADAHAVAVWANVTGRGAYRMGYMPRTEAARIAPLIDKGVRIKAMLEAIVGGADGLFYGLRYRVAV